MDADARRLSFSPFERLPITRLAAGKSRGTSPFPPPAPQCGRTTRSSSRLPVSWSSLANTLTYELPGDLVERYPTIAEAYAISRRADWERLVLESWILTAPRTQEIAHNCAVPEPVIDDYEKLFFSVRNSLKATAYCWHAAIRCRRVSPDTPAALEKLIRKWSSISAGARSLESALPAIGRHGVLIDRPANLATAEGRRYEHVRVAAKLSMATEEPENAMDLLRALLFILRTLERMPGVPRRRC